jgi:hypothetical protein
LKGRGRRGLTEAPALEALPARLDAEALALEIAALAEEPRLEALEAAEAAALESCRLSAESFNPITDC